MADVVLLSLAGRARAGSAPEGVRVPVRSCADALRRAGAEVRLINAGSDQDIDAAVGDVLDGEARLIVAASGDGEVRAVVRRMVRRNAPPPSKRPAELAPDRTMFDLPPLSILPLRPAIPPLVHRLGLPTAPEAVAVATLTGRARRLDLLRNDAGSATLHGCLVGGYDQDGAATIWRGRVEVDALTLADGEERLLACSIRNAGSSIMDGLPLVTNAQPDDGLVHVAVAVPTLQRHLVRQASVRFEVRRASGRAVSVVPRDDRVSLIDDGVTGELSHKRAWWIEAGAWAVYES